MSKETELRTFSKLEQGEQLPWTSVPKSVRNSTTLQELLVTNILTKLKRGAGSVLLVMDHSALQQFLDQRFPGRHTAKAGSAFGNQSRYRNSKGAAKTSIGVLLLRGWQTIRVNDDTVNLVFHTQQFGCFSAIKPRLKAPKLCLVENLDCFMKAEQLLGQEWVFAHTYGRLGSDTLAGLEAAEILHFGDWDYTGLDEFLRLRENFSQAKLYVPENLQMLWKSRSTPLKKGAVLTQRLKQSDDPEIIKILGLLGSTHSFLEQQAIFSPKNELS
jgi:hypothetical protein